ncbi:hypothetical protein HanIR_Chr11g0512101 [Helianthus annuus]|nr:hypothetical protein HanIR_Chr11g0512101 [Helianthus annuus]
MKQQYPKLLQPRQTSHLSRTPSLLNILFIFPINNNKALPRFKCFNSRSPLPIPIDLSLITYVRALPD